MADRNQARHFRIIARKQGKQVRLYREFVTDTCPNCRKRHVPACAKGLNYEISAAQRNDSEHHATIEKGLRIDALPERTT
jgi:hypothetical protein